MSIKVTIIHEINTGDELGLSRLGLFSKNIAGRIKVNNPRQALPGAVVVNGGFSVRVQR
jgi:hypothetical protein